VYPNIQLRGKRNFSFRIGGGQRFAVTVDALVAEPALQPWTSQLAPELFLENHAADELVNSG